jgi:hypothetical protein
MTQPDKKQVTDKVALLMEETGCERGEAELALEMCGFELEKAVKAVPRLLKNIVVLKGKFRLPQEHQFGLILAVLNLKSRAVLRTRAVVSFNPAVYGVSLAKDWFEFEKYLFGCRLWEGSLQAESQEIEQNLAAHFRTATGSPAFSSEPGVDVSAEVAGVLGPFFQGAAVDLNVRKEILDLGQFQSLGPSEAAPARRPRRSTAGQEYEPLILKIGLDEDEAGVPAEELRAGDLVSARIVDTRDIAQYLSKLFGCYSEKGPQPVAAPIEAVESGEEGTLVRVRMAVGVCGDAQVPPGKKLKVQRGQEQRPVPWWRRFFLGQ